MDDFRKRLQSDKMGQENGEWDNEEIWKEIEKRLPKKKRRRVVPFLLWGMMSALILYFLNYSVGKDASPLVKSMSAELSLLEEGVEQIRNIEKAIEVHEPAHLTITEVGSSSTIEEKALYHSVITLDQSGDLQEKPDVVRYQEYVRSDWNEERMDQGLDQNIETSTSKKDVAGQENMHVQSTGFVSNPLPTLGIKKLLLNPLEIVMPDVTKGLIEIDGAKETRWSWSISGGVQIFDKTLAPSSIDHMGLAEIRSATESPEESIYLSARVFRGITPWGLDVYAGMMYLQYNERVSHRYRIETQRQIFSDQATYIDQPDGKRFYLAGLLTERQITSGEINKYNETRFLTIPLGLRIQTGVHGWTLGAQVGTSLSLYHSASGDFVLPDHKLVAKESTGTQQLSGLIGYDGSIQIGKALKGSLQLITNIGYRRIQTTGGDAGLLREQFDALSISIGLEMPIQ